MINPRNHWAAINTPVVIIQQPAEKDELALLVQDLDLHEVCELSGECLHVLVEPSKIVLNMVSEA